MLKFCGNSGGKVWLKRLFKLTLALNSGFAAAAFLGFFWFGLAVGFVLFLLIFFNLFKSRVGAKVVVALLLAFCFGVFCFFVHDFVFRVRALKFDEASAFVCAKVVDVKKMGSENEAYLLKIEQVDEKKLVLPVFVNIYSRKGFRLFHGDKIKADVSFFAKKSAQRAALNSSRAKNVYLNGKILNIYDVDSGSGFFDGFHKARNDLISVVDFAVAEPANFLVNSIFLGTDSRLPYEIKRGFDCCGLSHIFAVSGLHISILFACLLCCMRFLKIPKWCVATILVFLLFCYNILLGFCVSAIRASLMNLAYFFANLFGKRLNSVRLLCFVATLILLFFPGSIYSHSFVFSFSSCLGILIFFKRISFAMMRRFLIFSGWPKFFVDCFALSLSAMFFSSPFLALCFGKISLIAPFANLILMPFVPSILIFSGLTAISGVCGLFSVSSFFGYFCEGIFYELVVLTKFFSKLPFSFVPTRYFFAPLVVVGLMAFILFVFLYARRLLFSKTVALFGCLIVFVPVLSNFVLAKGASTISLISNGTGFSTVINSADRVIVLNCGGFSCEKHLCEFLDGRGIKKIDFLIFLSNESNNMNCDLQTIVKSFETFCVMMPFNENGGHLAKTLAKERTNLLFLDQAHFVNFPIAIDFLSSTTTKDGFNCHMNLGGLSFSYCLSESEFMQMQKLMFSNVAIVDDYVKNYDKNLNCGFLISTKPGNVKASNFFAAQQPYGIDEFLIYGGYIKRMGL